MAAIILPDYMFTDSVFTHHDRFVWWCTLVRYAAEIDGEIEVNGKIAKISEGRIITTLSGLTELLAMEKRTEARWFVERMVEAGYLKCSTEKRSITLEVCNLADYVNTQPNTQLTRSQSTNNDEVTHNPTHNSESNTQSNTQLNASLSTDNEQSIHNLTHNLAKEEKKKEEKVPPTPPIKEENKKRRKCSTEGHATGVACLHTRARKVFEDFYFSTYNSPYYFDAKDAGHLKRLLNKIAYSRSHRTVPLPTDDDSMIEAFKQFLSSINKQWIQNNFSITQISSHYNEIISEIRNRTNPQSNGRKQITEAGAGGLTEVRRPTEEKKRYQSTI